jgi:hypothetical protein
MSALDLSTILVFQVIEECPSLKGHKMEIDFALGKALINNMLRKRRKRRYLSKYHLLISHTACCVSG